jgi:hypothetical protein
MLKVFSTDVLWRIINDTIQIYGGKAYFTDEPYERMMRDGRINMIGEGANDVLRVFSALVGMREVGLDLKAVLDALFSPIGNFRKLSGFAGRRIGSMFASPEVPVRNPALEDEAARLGRLIGHFGGQVERLLRQYQESIMDRQFLLGRVADAATELYASTCVLLRLDHMLTAAEFGHSSHGKSAHGNGAHESGAHESGAHESGAHESGAHENGAHEGGAHENGAHSNGEPSDAECNQRAIAAGRYYLLTAARRIRRNLADLWDNDDQATAALANRLLGGK